jgi:hypothetical protein
MKMAPLIAFISLSICWPALAGPESVRNVEVRDAPEAKVLAGRARQIGDEVYPQILALLADGKPDMPRRLDIVFREHLIVWQSNPGEEWEGYALRKAAFLNAGRLCQHPEELDAVLVHEMAHVAQNYPHMAFRHAWQSNAHWLGFKVTHPFRSYPPAGPLYWVEGIADYVCAKLGHTNALECTQCDERFPHYKEGYKCAAAFLLYIDAAYGSDVIRRLNAAMRGGAYSDQFFAKATGKTLDELWGDFQKTHAFTPIAAEFNELHQALGYNNGKPPADLEPRLEKYFSKHPEIRDFFATLGAWHGKPPEDVQNYIHFFLYTRHQPGGQQMLQETEATFKELHQALGYKEGKPPQDIRARVLAYLDAHPDIKETVVVNGALERVPLPEIQGFIEGATLARLQPGGKITVAAADFLTRLKNQGKLPGWGKSEHGTVSIAPQGKDAETYPVDRTFEARKKARSEIYIYTAVKDSPESDWKLKRAWETTAKGRLLKDFSVQ